MAVAQNSKSNKPRRSGFRQTGSLLSDRLRQGGEGRGFSQTRLLTQWTEIVGADIAKQTRPVKITYPKQAIGSTLTILCSGAVAPLVQMKIPVILERVNAAYGYRAVARVKLTQTAQTGFNEAQKEFARKEVEKTAPDPARVAKLSKAVAPVQSETLRDALDKLGQNIISKSSQ